MTRNMLFALSLGFGGMLFAAGQAFGQAAQCADHSQIIVRLAERYGETRQGVGLGQNNSIVEIYASRDTGTWTILVTMPDGIACLVASGEAWDVLAEELPKPGEGA